MGADSLGMSALRIESVRLTDWQEAVVGVWVAEDDAWLLLRVIPMDFVVDGYVLIAKQHVESRPTHPDGAKIKHVLELKGVRADLPPNFVFGGTLELLRWVEQQYGLIQFQDEDEESALMGWLKKADATRFQIDSLRLSGRVDRSFNNWFELAEIRLIVFDADYFNSLKLLWQDILRRQWQLKNPN